MTEVLFSLLSRMEDQRPKTEMPKFRFSPNFIWITLSYWKKSINTYKIKTPASKKETGVIDPFFWIYSVMSEINQNLFYTGGNANSCSYIGHPSSVIQPTRPNKIRKLEEKRAYRFSNKAKLSEAPILFHILLSKEPWLWENW